ncbi:MAG: glycosyltransferase family 4 protein [Acidobacteriota bacterium]
MRARLILVVPAFPKLSETFIVSKAAGLLEAGWDVHVVCQRGGQEEWQRFPDAIQAALRRRVHVTWPVRPRFLPGALLPASVVASAIRAPESTTRYLRRGRERFGWDALRRIYLDAKVMNLSPDIVHFEFGTLAVGKTYLKELLGCRISVSFRGFDLNFAGLEDPRYYEEVFREADLIHCLGEDLWRRAMRRGCPPHKEHVLIPPAIDVAFFDPGERAAARAVGTPARPVRILSVGRLEWKKGYEDALQAVHRLRLAGTSVEYRIVGEGNYLEAVSYARHEMGLEDCVSLLGPLPPAGVKREMLWADVFLHAAVSEGFCNAVIEAQAMELPVVCTDADGLSENVCEGETGFVVPRRDPEAMALGISRLAADPSLREGMGREGRRRVEKSFRIEDQIAAFDRAYKRLLGA